MTKDAEKMLCCLYKEYLKRVESGNSKTSSKTFYQYYVSNDKILSKWHSEDFNATKIELKNSGYLLTNVIGSYTLTSEAIEFMENRLKNNMGELAEFITKFIP